MSRNQRSERTCAKAKGICDFLKSLAKHSPVYLLLTGILDSLFSEDLMHTNISV